MTATPPDEPDPGALLGAFGLRGPARAMVRVPGAWSNRVWRLSTGSRSCWRESVPARAVLDAYAGARGPVTGRLRPTDLARSLMSSLDWLALCARRALAEGAPPADSALVRRLAAEFPDQVRAALRVDDLSMRSTAVPLVR